MTTDTVDLERPPSRLAARLAGALFICATAASLLDTSLLRPVLADADYLSAAAADPGRVTTGALLQVVAGMSAAGIAVALYPVIRRRAVGLAIGAVAFRLVEGTLFVIGAIGALLVLRLGQYTVTTGSGGSAEIGEVLLALRDRSSQIAVLVFYLGATLYYLAFLRHRLLPRWLSVWGLTGTGLGAVAGLLAYYGALGFMSPVQVVLNLPIAVNEMVLAVWLIVVGFTAPAVAPRVAEPSAAPNPLPSAAPSPVPTAATATVPTATGPDTTGPADRAVRDR